MADGDQTLCSLVAAVGEYAEHLRSHTEVMRNLAASTGELQAAAVDMRQMIAGIAHVLAALDEG